ncbi:conserved hypothetical protein [Theileria equi strain WA]|uniref:RING-type domain-containing protein n=1 Tax=Theileria equi strain WA TaxID=1537102 RepID=L1LFR3_THEEQ|nr:conserved hypothetical protein [Theileria equi strain WA]EKX74196.1 conserved hypothetical protein [Theileria equi strain WA]|eukprot:XP_004833648.1 conserved hypothetical protein [Theileria equi strain WA]
MESYLKQFDWFCYRNVANSRFIAGKSGALQSYGMSNLLILFVFSLILARIFYLIYEYHSIWHIAKQLHINPKAIHLHGMAEYASEIVDLYYTHFNQILRFKRRVKPVPIPRIRMPLSLDANSIRVSLDDPNPVDYVGRMYDNENRSTSLAINFNFDCSKTTFVSAHWGVPIEIVEAITIASKASDSRKKRTMENSIVGRSLSFIRSLTLPFYPERRFLLEDSIGSMSNASESCGDISLLCSQHNFCSSEPICFNAGSKIECKIKPTIDYVESSGINTSIWDALVMSQEDTVNKRIPLVIVLYTPRTQDPRIFSEGGVESHQGYAEITLVGFRKFKSEAYTSSLSRLSTRVFKQVVFSGDAIKPQEPRDMFGMGDVRDTECLICIANKMDTVLLPCGHGSFCSKCLYGLRNDKCPVCRRNFYSYVKFPLKS